MVDARRSGMIPKASNLGAGFGIHQHRTRERRALVGRVWPVHPPWYGPHPPIPLRRGGCAPGGWQGRGHPLRLCRVGAPECDPASPPPSYRLPECTAGRYGPRTSRPWRGRRKGDPAAPPLRCSDRRRQAAAGPPGTQRRVSGERAARPSGPVGWGVAGGACDWPAGCAPLAPMSHEEVLVGLLSRGGRGEPRIPAQNGRSGCVPDPADAARRTALAETVIADHKVSTCHGCGPDGCPSLRWARRELGITDG
jgi:hypothetical protein